MKKKILLISIISIIFIGFVVLADYGIHWAFFDTQRIHGQEVLETSVSPNGTYTITAYLNNGGATTDYAVLCTAKNNTTGETRNIYWNYHCETASIAWESDTIVSINNVRLDVQKDTYDFRNDKTSLN